MNYTILHLHDELSLLDSTTKFEEYVDKAVELGMKSIARTNHGNVYKWIEKLMYCKKKGIKYIHGCEIYLTETLDEKIRDNYHTILIAKNESGRKELHTLLDMSTKEDHMYYKNRITFDEFLNISDNIIKISACLASPLSKLNHNNSYYEKLINKYDFLEIQYHNCKDQIEFNKHLYELSLKYNKPLVVGTDTHNLDEYHAECRAIRLLSKNITFSNEDDFDLTFKSYDELIEQFEVQNSLPMNIVLEAIENTNKIADMCEEIELDLSFKYPILSSDDEKTLIDRTERMLNDKINKGIIDGNNPKYKENLKEELRVFKKLNMMSFMLFMSEMIEWCENNNIPTCPCRGSVGGSTLAYITGITDVDPIKWGTVFSRFANEDRLEIGDIDCDFSPSQRELVYKYIIDRFGVDNTAYILAIGTVSDKGTIDDIGRALKTKYKGTDKEKLYSLDNIKKIKKEYEENPDETKEKYNELFYYFDGIVNSVVSQSVHPAGIVASPVTLYDNYGTFWKDGMRILQIDMEEVHEVSLVKYDILGLKNIEIIKDCCEYANIPYPKAHKVNFEDDNVWDDMVKSPYGIFQFESEYSNDLLKKFNPHKINDMNLVNASLRPSGESYRDRLLSGEINKNPSEIIDELLSENNGYLVFQEDTIAFLQNICGLSGSEADNIRRAIGRKQKDRLEKAMPDILEGYCSMSNKERSVAEEEAKVFLKIIEDSSSYQFGKNHSTGYSMIGYYCAMLRYYYPLEFTTSYLNNAKNDEDLINGENLAKLKNIKIKQPKFRYSRADYFMDKQTNSIYKGISSIKYLNTQVGELLYSLRDNQYNSFVDLLIDINKKVNRRQMEILIKLDYFAEFGKSSKLMQSYELFNNIYEKKQLKKDKYPHLNEYFSKHCTTETTAMYKFDDTIKLLKDIVKDIPNENINIAERVMAWKEYVGSCSLIDKRNPRDCVVTDIDLKYTPRVEMYCLGSGNTQWVKISKRIWKNNKLQKGDLVNLCEIHKKHKRKNVEGKWIELDDFELWTDEYIVK